MRCKICLLLLLFLPVCLLAQKQKADSLAKLLSTEKTDTGKVKLMWQEAGVVDVYDPEKALVLAQQALVLATRLKYTDGQSKALGLLS